jgi:hypothetical protein
LRDLLRVLGRNAYEGGAKLRQILTHESENWTQRCNRLVLIGYVANRRRQREGQAILRHLQQVPPRITRAGGFPARAGRDPKTAARSPEPGTKPPPHPPGPRRRAATTAPPVTWPAIFSRSL